MPDFLSFINEILWGSVMIYLLSAAGIWFTFRCGFIQFRAFRYLGKSLKNSLSPQPGGLTSFQALCTSLAARVGSGNLTGVGAGHQRRWPWRRFLDVGHRALRDGHRLCRMLAGSVV